MKLLPLTLSPILCLAWLALPLAASAGDYWRFETDEGVVSFVDDAKKIPEKYRERAVREEAKGLESYTRATQAVDSAALTPWGPGIPMRLPDDTEVREKQEPRYTRTKERRWVDAPFGAPGDVYALVEVVRDADGEIVSVELHDPDTVRVVEGR